jgi:EpsI family protein
MKRSLLRWTPAAILAVGVILVQTVDAQQRVLLRQPLDAVVPATFDGFDAQDIEISEAEQRVAGMSTYLMRLYQDEEGQAFTLYVGYYENQTEGSEIHSPRNCLPGAGWESITATRSRLDIDGRSVLVNQHMIRRDDEQALVLYWYQGRGRVAANELSVKWQLLRDAALRGRTEEALVRIVVPMTATDDGADLAHRIARTVIPMVDRALPTID